MGKSARDTFTVLSDARDELHEATGELLRLGTRPSADEVERFVARVENAAAAVGVALVEHLAAEVGATEGK